MAELTELPDKTPQRRSMMCAPKPCQLFVRSVITPEADHDACDGDLFTCECECHDVRIVDLDNMKLMSYGPTLGEGFPGSKIIKTEKIQNRNFHVDHIINSEE